MHLLIHSSGGFVGFVELRIEYNPRADSIASRRCTRSLDISMPKNKESLREGVENQTAQIGR